MEETGRYLITAHLTNPIHSESFRKPRQFVCTFELDIYQGWQIFHAGFRGGAMGLSIKRQGKGWVSKDPAWAVDEVRMVTRAEYLAALEKWRESPYREF